MLARRLGNPPPPSTCCTPGAGSRDARSAAAAAAACHEPSGSLCNVTPLHTIPHHMHISGCRTRPLPPRHPPPQSKLPTQAGWGSDKAHTTHTPTVLAARKPIRAAQTRDGAAAAVTRQPRARRTTRQHGNTRRRVVTRRGKIPSSPPKDNAFWLAHLWFRGSALPLVCYQPSCPPLRPAGVPFSLPSARVHAGRSNCGVRPRGWLRSRREHTTHTSGAAEKGSFEEQRLCACVTGTHECAQAASMRSRCAYAAASERDRDG